MDNPLPFTPSKESLMNKLEDLLKALLKNGLKILPKKCQLFRNQSTIYGQGNIYSKQEGMCTTLEKQVGNDTKTTTPNHSKRM